MIWTWFLEIDIFIDNSDTTVRLLATYSLQLFSQSGFAKHVLYIQRTMYMYIKQKYVYINIFIYVLRRRQNIL